MTWLKFWKSRFIALSTETRLELSEIPWRQIIGMRNRLMHGYDDVDLAIVWNTDQNDLPLLIA